VNGGDSVPYLKTTPSAPNQTVCIYGQNFIGQYPVNKINIKSAYPTGIEGNYSPFSIVQPVTPVDDTQIEFQLQGVPFEHNHLVLITAIKSNDIESNPFPTNWKVDGIISSIKLDSDTTLSAPYGIGIGETPPVVRVYGTYMDAKNDQSGFHYSGIQRGESGITCTDSRLFEQYDGTYFKVKLPATTTKGSHKFWRRRKRDILGESISTLELPNQFIYYQPEPQISTIQPNVGIRTDSHPVTISGHRLYYSGETTKVFVNNVQVNVTNSTENELHITVPPSQSSGWVPIKVQRSGGPWPADGIGIQETTIPQGFQYTQIPVPTITNVNPNNGPTTGGTSIIITGTNFVNVSSVRVGGVAAVNYTVNSSTQITATTPSGTAGVQQIEVTTPFGSAYKQFTYTVPPPTITNVNPNNGPTTGGTSIIITGTNFVGVSSVTVGGAAATYTVNSSTQITATTPLGTAGVRQIVVTTQTGFASVSFTYTVPQPTITSVTPNSGWGEPDYGGQSNPPATSVTITGSNLDDCTVKIGNKDCVITNQSSGSITIDVPVQTDGFEGPQQLTVNRTGATSATETFTYTLPPPLLKIINGSHDISPTSCVYTGGCVIQANGWYLKNSSNQSHVVFNTQPQIEVQCNSDSTRNQLKFTSPDVTSSNIGLCDLTFKRHDNQGDDSEDSFTFTSSQIPLQITSIDPTSGPMAGGNTITITGQNFTQNGGVNQVLIGGVACAYVNVLNPTTVTATVPGSSSTGPRAVEVKNAYQQSAVLSDAYTYTTSCPQPTAIAPNNGPACSSTGVNFTITGSNLLGINEIIFNNDTDLSATNIIVHTDGNSLTAITPVQFPPATWDLPLAVTVKKPGCTDTTLNAGYTPRSANYTITNAEWQNAICQGSGNFGQLYINGNNFTNQGIHKVSLQTMGFGDSIIAHSFNVVSPNQITAQFDQAVQAGSWTVYVETPCDSRNYPLSYIPVCGPPICSGILDWWVPVNNEGTVVNLVTLLLEDNVSDPTDGWDFRLRGTSLTPLVVMDLAPGTRFMQTPGLQPSDTQRTNLAVGTVVGDSGYFFFGSTAAIPGSLIGQWTLNATGYFGVKFFNEETTAYHYGYVAMYIGANATVRRIVGFCWNPIPNAPITVQVIQ